MPPVVSGGIGNDYALLVCQQILILSKGHLAAAGSLEELTADGKSLEEVFLELTDGEPEEATGEEEAE